MPTNESERSVGAWVRRWWRALLAELVATALLVLLGIAAMLPVGGEARPLSHPALTFGFIVVANVEIFGPVSGAHMNPALTLAALAARRLPAAAAAAAYALAQLAGALLGFGALLALAPAAATSGATHPAPGLSLAAALALEATLTGTLAMLACAVWAAHDQQRPDRAVSLKFGLALAGLIYAGGPFTGASLNPARSFAPALFQGMTADHWVYWVGPLGGALVGALVHRALLAPRPETRASRDALPLADKREP
ncbi:unnamed protein product, partial [Iphiclides podalirius]